MTKRRLDYDLTVLGIAATKTSFNKAEGIKIDYVDPATIVYSYTEDPYFEDLYYVGEVKEVTVAELQKNFLYYIPNIKRYRKNVEVHVTYTNAYGSRR